jgi:hypothetical protein
VAPDRQYLKPLDGISSSLVAEQQLRLINFRNIS